MSELEDMNAKLWFLFTADLDPGNDDEGKDVCSTLQSFEPNAQFTPNVEVLSMASSGILGIDSRYPRGRVLDDWRQTSRNFRPSPVFRSVKKLESRSISSEHSEHSRSTIAPFQFMKLLEEGTISELWAESEEGSNDSSTTSGDDGDS